METHETAAGSEIDRCPQCGALWFDRGELMVSFRDREALERAIERARGGATTSLYRSPRSGAPLIACPLPRLAEAYLDAQSGGVLVSGEGVRRLLKSPALLELTEASRGPDGSDELPRLPPLHLRSVATLTGLYGVLSLFLIVASLYGKFSPGTALLLAALVVFAQFLVGPFFMDLFLCWAQSMRFADPSELPDHLREFITRVCTAHGMRFPRIGIIGDQSPNAFTYGHTPQNARVVITAGLFELLEPEELEAVVGHELGHARHWDMLVMTMAQLVPMVMYYLYRSLARLRAGKGKAAEATTALAIGAYLVYIVSEYIVLWLSRTRELWADRFSGEVTRSPAALGRALVKIAYGLAGRNRAETEKSAPRVRAAGALGIFDGRAAQALAITTYGEPALGEPDAQAAGGGGRYSINVGALKAAMRWDLWNPWAAYYELHSTHPRTGKRLLMLSAQSEKLGEKPLVRFDLVRPESYWDDFLVDLLVVALPLLAVAATVAMVAWRPHALGFGVMLIGIAMAIKLRFRYPNRAFPEMSVETLLSEVKVSEIRPVPCRLEGAIRGRGVPGLIWSDDFVMQDPTGIILIDHRQPLSLWEWLWGWMRGASLIGEQVQVEGWYRRAPIPFVEIKQFTVGGRTRRCYLRHFRWATALAVVALGIWLQMRIR